MKSPLIKTPARYGLLGGLIGGTVIIALYSAGIHPFLLPVIVDFRIAIFSIFIFFSLKELRERYYDGTLFFWQGMVASFVVVLVSGLIGSCFAWGIAKWNSDFLPSYISKLQQQLLGFKKDIIESVGVDAYNQQLARLPHTSPLDLAGDYFLKSLIIGLFLAILISVILRKQPKPE